MYVLCIQSMCRCLESIKCQICQLTKSNECMRQERDDLCQMNQAYKCRITELDRELVRLNDTIDCLRDKVLTYHTRVIIAS